MQDDVRFIVAGKKMCKHYTIPFQRAILAQS